MTLPISTHLNPVEPTMSPNQHILETGEIRRDKNSLSIVEGLNLKGNCLLWNHTVKSLNQM